MRTVNRRELNQHSAAVLDSVLDTGEPVEVVTRGRGSVVISRKVESLYETWIRQDLVVQASRRLSDAPTMKVSRPVEDVIADISSDH